MLLHKEHLNLAEDWINRSLKLEQNWMNLLTKALLLHSNIKVKMAINYGEMAIINCKKNKEFCPYFSAYSFPFTKWKNKMSTDF